MNTYVAISRGKSWLSTHCTLLTIWYKTGTAWIMIVINHNHFHNSGSPTYLQRVGWQAPSNQNQAVKSGQSVRWCKAYILTCPRCFLTHSLTCSAATQPTQWEQNESEVLQFTLSIPSGFSKSQNSASKPQQCFSNVFMAVGVWQSMS